MSSLRTTLQTYCQSQVAVSRRWTRLHAGAERGEGAPVLQTHPAGFAQAAASSAAPWALLELNPLFRSGDDVGNSASAEICI